MTHLPAHLSDAAIRQLQQAIDLPDLGDRFSVRGLIGQGGMGRVYAVFDHLLEREVALKVLSLDAETVDLAQRLVREARVLALLEHPGIAAVHDAGTMSDGRPFYVMRFVRGVSLVDPRAIGVRGERLRVFLRICDAVAFAHARGVVHRDIKPSNIMIGEYGDVVVLDWGVAKVLNAPVEPEAGGIDRTRDGPTQREPDATREGTVIGTPGFMAPEQAAGASSTVDIRADVYGLGALLQHLIGVDDSVPVPRPLTAIVGRAMAATPTARYQRVDDLAADVRRWLDGFPVTAYREHWWEVVTRFADKNRALLLLLAAYVAVRMAILFWRGV